MQKVRHEIIGSFKRFPQVEEMLNTGFRKYKTDEGKMSSRFLFQFEDFLKLNEFHFVGKVPIHAHFEDEYIFLVEGDEGEIHFLDDKEQITKIIHHKIGKAIYVPAGQVHTGQYNTRSRFITVTVPPSNDYAGA